MTATKANLRGKILEAARKQLVRHGIQQVSMRKVARAIGYTATSIYYHFKNKDELIFALIDEGYELLYQQLREAQDALPPDTDGIRRIEANMRAYFAFADARPEYYEIMYMVYSEELARYPKESYRKSRRSLDLGTALFEQARREGLAVDVDPGVVTSALAVALHGYVSQKMLRRIDARHDTDALPETLIQTLLRGIRRPEGG